MSRVAALALACALPAALLCSVAVPPARAEAPRAEGDPLQGATLRPTLEIASLTPSEDPAADMAPLMQTAQPALDARYAMRPKLVAKVSLERQEMTVLVDGKVAHTWKVSTAGKGYKTPKGVWTPYRMHTMWHSRKYDNAPMPHSIFYTGGYAIHATPHVKRLGQPASHGCVRLHPDNAKVLFQLAKSVGRDNMRVVVEN